ncbi:cytochrome P450 [Ascobolus immersus RN42]|uniref:Cytochrome P450 n=1 Tax=Ascobolus immersus RN42 TaxID=1160509 RepID=A0A3N4I2U5_ASCIM|nr:cytochrome P450 [Ascobolus immersus RN42]
MNSTTAQPLPHTVLLTTTYSYLRTTALLLYLYPLGTLTTAFVLYLTTLSIYRLLFHPLRHFPGPTLAKLSRLYEVYFDIFSPGFVFHAEKVLHPKYGKVVRVGPNRLRVADGESWFEIHAVTTPFTKDPSFYRAFNRSTSLFSLIDNQEHKERRKLLMPLFTRKSILQLTPLVRQKARLLVEKWGELCEAETSDDGFTTVDVGKGFMALTADLVGEYIYGESYNILNSADLSHPLLDTVAAFPSFLYIGKLAPWISPLIERLPERIIGTLNPGTLALKHTQVEAEARINALQASSVPTTPTASILLDKASSPSPFPAQPALPTNLITELAPVYPSAHILATDASTILTASLLSTSYTLTHLTHHLALLQESSSAQTRVLSELLSAYPGGLSDFLLNVQLEVLEKMPYLTAFIKESLRLSYGIAGGLRRLSPKRETKLAGLAIPPGTEVVSSIYTLHHTAEFFPNPDIFNPERWLPTPAAKEGENNERNMVAFGTGRRMCLGKELALLEIYTVVGAVVLGFEVRGEGEWKWKERWLPVRVGGGEVGLRRRR